MQKWKYLTLVHVADMKNNKAYWFGNEEDTRSAQEILEQLGEEGWELVSVTSVSMRGNTQGLNYYFKRPVE
jgi:hypothetical protein